MASQVTHSPSRIPLPVKNSATIPVTGIFVKELVDGGHIPPSLQPSTVSHIKENGNLRSEKLDLLHSPQAQKGKGFETFLMTGEMIIHANPTVTQKPVSEVKTFKDSHIPRLGQNDQRHTDHGKVIKPPNQQHILSSPQLHSKIPAPIKNHNLQKQHTSSSQENHSALSQDINHHMTMTGQVRDFPFVHAPVAEMEELSDLSQSSCSESELCLESDSATQSPSLPVSNQPDIQTPHSPNTGSSRLDQAVEPWGQLQTLLPGSSNAGFSDTLYSEPPSLNDISFVHDGHIYDPDVAGRGFISSERTLYSDGSFLSDETLIEKEGTLSADNINSKIGPVPFGQAETSRQTIIASSSGEKFIVHSGNTERFLVRTSKSHENYLQAGTNTALVSIDIDDSLAYSLDTLTYHDSPDSSLDNVASEPVQMSRSLDNSPEKKSEKSSSLEREFIPGFINLEDSKPAAKLKACKQRDDENETNEINNSGNFCSDLANSASLLNGIQSVRRISGEDKANGDISTREVQYNSGGDSLQLSLLRDEADADSLYHQPSKAVDKPSAERLAKRLYNLEGFRKSDVSRHLCKKNDFSNLVAEEYLKFFDFQEDTLDQALRRFLLRFSLYGETQERERVLAHFSRRFLECNPGSFNSEDACHTLTCAIMLLNSDLHSPNVSRRMTCQEFIENLAELNDGENFSKEVLKAIYQSIKNEPIEWAVDDVTSELEGTHSASEPAGSAQSPPPQALGSNPFLEVPDPSKTTEYKKGYVMRKCCMDPDRRKTPLGKRGWKMLYAVLRDMILYQYKDEHQLKKGHFVESTQNAIRIHHSLATKALDYTKKQHVFRLQTADWAEYLFQTGDSKELQEWVDMINLVAASLSAPVLPGAVGSRSKFQRQLLPSSCTRLNLREQLHNHESRIHDLEQELLSHHMAAPEKGAKSSVIQEYLDKESYLEFEIKRFRTYVCLLQSKLLAFPDLEPSLVETTIGEYEELGAGPSRVVSSQPAVIMSATKSGLMVKPVQRSMSDSFHRGTDGTPTLRRTPIINKLSECTKM